MTTGLPLPPRALMNRVGALPQADAQRVYEELGRLGRDFVIRHLPPGYDFTNRHVLDFGCGAGRTLRQFIEMGLPGTNFWGCDIDTPSVDWINDNLRPTASAVASGEEPPLPWPDDSFDVIYALSVFTHLAHHWSAWLVELRRVLRPDGVLILTYLGPAFLPVMFGDRADEEALGMAVLRPYGEWEHGGPMVVHAPWWIEEHWGRAFDITQMHEQCVSPSGAAELGEGPFQSCCVLRPKPEAWTAEDIERPAASDPRDFIGVQHSLRLSWLELRDTERQLAAARRELAELRGLTTTD